MRYLEPVHREVGQYRIRRNNALAVSVRTWTAAHEHVIGRSYSFEAYAAAIRETLSANRQIDTILLSLDNDQHARQYEDLISGFNVTVVTLRFDEHKSNYLQHIVAKVLLMSKCAYFICNRISTFSELVFWFAECKQHVLALM